MQSNVQCTQEHLQTSQSLAEAAQLLARSDFYARLLEDNLSTDSPNEPGDGVPWLQKVQTVREKCQELQNIVSAEQREEAECSRRTADANSTLQHLRTQIAEVRQKVIKHREALSDVQNRHQAHTQGRSRAEQEVVQLRSQVVELETAAEAGLEAAQRLQMLIGDAKVRDVLTHSV